MGRAPLRFDGMAQGIRESLRSLSDGVYGPMARYLLWEISMLSPAGGIMDGETGVGLRRLLRLHAGDDMLDVVVRRTGDYARRFPADAVELDRLLRRAECSQYPFAALRPMPVALSSDDAAGMLESYVSPLSRLVARSAAVLSSAEGFAGTAVRSWVTGLLSACREARHRMGQEAAAGFAGCTGRAAWCRCELHAPVAALVSPDMDQASGVRFEVCARERCVARGLLPDVGHTAGPGPELGHNAVLVTGPGSEAVGCLVVLERKPVDRRMMRYPGNAAITVMSAVSSAPYYGACHALLDEWDAARLLGTRLWEWDVRRRDDDFDLALHGRAMSALSQAQGLLESVAGELCRDRVLVGE